MVRANRLFGAAVVAGGAWLVGCQETPTTAPAATGNGVRSDVTDVRPVDPVVAPAFVPAAYQPPAYEANGGGPLIASSMTPSPGTTAGRVKTATLADDTITPSASSTVGGTHVVRKGETLFSIAKATYGDGKQWKKIVAANPGISASKLRVGQKLNMPS